MSVPRASFVFWVVLLVAALSRPAAAHALSPWVTPTVLWSVLGIVLALEIAFVLVILRIQQARRRARPEGAPRARAGTLGKVAVAASGVLGIVALGGLALLGGSPTQPQAQVYDSDPPGALRVEVKAFKLQWDFRYPVEGIDNRTEIHVPAGRDVTLDLESRDVVHAFDIPSLGIRREVIPGRPGRLSFRALAPGRHAIVCTAACGSVTGQEMPGVLVVDPEGTFAEWVTRKKQQPPAPTPIPKAGSEP